MKKILILSCLFLSFDFVDAQIAFAVAKDENGSTVDWQYYYSDFADNESTVKEKLEAKGHLNIQVQSGNKNCGHNLPKGTVVIVEAKYKTIDGKEILSYGLGVSETSKAAEKRAIKNLKQYDKSWKNKYGYRIVQNFTYSTK